MFVIFNTNGERIYSHKTTANLGAACVSPDSTITVFETYGSETEDSNNIFIVDINEKRILNKFPRPLAFNSICIDTINKTLNLIDNRGFSFKVDFDGEQINKEEFEKQILTKGSVYDKLRLYESRPDEVKLKDPKYADLLIRSLHDKDSSHAFGKDILYRRLGEYYQTNGDIPKTIESWEKALQHNPKVGIKRKLDTLKRL